MQRLTYNLTGQVLTHVPDVRRASATWVLEDLRYAAGETARELDSGSATLDSATEDTTAAAGPTTSAPRQLTVASTSGFVVGTTYEIVSASGNGDRELGILAGTPSGALLMEHPLIGTYPTGSTVRGITLTTGALDSTVLQDEERMQSDWPMRVVWTYPDGTRAQEAVRLVRETATDLLIHRVIADLRDLFPDIDTRMQRHGRDTLRPQVQLQLRSMRADFLARGVRQEELLTGEKGHWALVWRTLWHLARLGNSPMGDGLTGSSAADWANYCKAEWERRWLALTVGEGGPEVVKLDRVDATAPASEDRTYRTVIGEL